MPRNQFQARDREDPEDEDQDQEVEPVEADPHEWPKRAEEPILRGLSLADFRKLPGQSVTKQHIAEEIAKRYSNRDEPLS